MINIKTILLFLLMVFIGVKFDKILTFFIHLFQFIKWKIIDFKKARIDKKSGVKKFKPFGLRMYCGRQGSGKTVSMVEYLHRLKKDYPKALIYTNFECDFADGQLQSLNDILTLRNFEDGIIFGIDELQNEFSSSTSKDFPESILSVVTQQRKQRIHIVASSQVYTRCSKPLREQCYEIIECRTFLGRWTRQRCYDAEDYNTVIDNPDPEKKFKLHKKFKYSFIQTDSLRDSYDTYSVVKRLSRDGFKPKIENYC